MKPFRVVKDDHEFGTGFCETDEKCVVFIDIDGVRLDEKVINRMVSWLEDSLKEFSK